MKQKLARLELQMKNHWKEYTYLQKEVDKLQKTIFEQYPRQMEKLGCMFATSEITLKEIEKLCELYLNDEDDPVTISGRPLSRLVFKELERMDIFDNEGIAYMYLPLLKLFVFDKTKSFFLPPYLEHDAFVCVYNSSQN
jgi:hypothetical protein